MRPGASGSLRGPQQGCLLRKSAQPLRPHLLPFSNNRQHYPTLNRTDRKRCTTIRNAAVVGNGNGQPKTGLRRLKDPDDNTCEIFIDEAGDIIQVMCCDYGFRSGFGRLYQGGDGEIPANLLTLGLQNFSKEYRELRRSFRFNEYREISRANPPSNPITKAAAWVGARIVSSFSKIDKQLEEKGIFKRLERNPLPEDVLDGNGELVDECAEIRDKLRQLKLDDAAVWKREHARKADPEAARPPFIIKAAYLALCWTLDVVYANRPLQRFWFLETVARMPYFSYISMLHLYESLGWWRAGAELRKIHFAEEWNELHHLQIMESLGGDQLWVDRFLAQHAAVFYYWVLIAFFIFSPTLSYAFSELVEGHAVDTYSQFVDQNEELLKSLPPPRVALEYYKSGDMYLYDELQTTNREQLRRPSCSTLYDVFSNIRDDEMEHVKTMKSCRDYSIAEDLASRRLTSFAPVTTLSMSDDNTVAAVANWKLGKSGGGNGNGSGNGDGNGDGPHLTGATPVESDVKTMDSTKLS